MDRLATGKTIGPYRILARIGGGGVGEVYRAEDSVLGRTVAIKSLRPELAARPAVVQRFRAEARTLARLNHPHIATLYSWHEDAGALLMVMEYVEGPTFTGLVRSRGRLEPELAFDLFHQALAGIGHAHEQGVVHRDVKGSNLMVGRGGHVKVMDFGIARVVGSERMTRVGNLIGTPEYMSPEQVRGQEARASSDIYSLGILLFELLCGRPPFQRSAEFDVLRAQVESPPPAPRALGAPVGEPLEAVVLRALAKDPEARFRSIDAFREALAAAGAPAPPRLAPDPQAAAATLSEADLLSLSDHETTPASELPPTRVLSGTQADDATETDLPPGLRRAAPWIAVGTCVGAILLIFLLLEMPEAASHASPGGLAASAPSRLAAEPTSEPERDETRPARGAAAEDGSQAEPETRPQARAAPASASAPRRRSRGVSDAPTSRPEPESNSGWVIRR